MVLFYCPPRGAWHESTHGVGDPVIVLQSWVDVFLVCGFRVSVGLVKCVETSAGCAVVPRLSVPTALSLGGVVFYRDWPLRPWWDWHLVEHQVRRGLLSGLEG